MGYARMHCALRVYCARVQRQSMMLHYVAHVHVCVRVYIWAYMSLYELSPLTSEPAVKLAAEIALL